MEGLGDEEDEAHEDEDEYGREDQLHELSDVHEQHAHHLNGAGHDFAELAQQPMRRKSSANHFGEASRHSLAFELASAMDPVSGSASLMAELGLNDGAHGGLQVHQEELEDHDEDRSIGQPETRSGGNHHRRAATTASSTLGGTDQSLRTPLRKAKSRASYASLGASPSAGPAGVGASPPLNGPSATSAFWEQQREEEDESDAAAFQEQAVALRECMSSTDIFLSRLREHDDVAVTDGSAVGQPASSVWTDRQGAVETLASALIRAMYQYLKQREDELKVLRETEKALLDADPAWQTALAELEPLPLALYAEVSVPRDVPSQNGHLETLAEEGEDVDQIDGPAAISPAQPAPPAKGVDADFKEAAQSVTIQFMEVRSATEGAIASLGAISEHAQISKATNTDASRKLKSIDSALTRLRSEAESIERSQAYIRAREAEEAQEANAGGSTAPRQSALPGLSAAPRKRKTSSHSTRSASSSTASNSGTGRFSERVRSEMKAAISLLETSHERARVLLAAASG